MKTRLDLQDRHEEICREYAEAFMRKHHLFDEETGEYFEHYWICDDPGTILCVADYCIDFHDIRTDINDYVKMDKYFEYYEYSMENEAKVNYKSYLKGAR